MTHELVLSYEIYKYLDVYVNQSLNLSNWKNAHKATMDEMALFHSKDYL